MTLKIDMCLSLYDESQEQIAVCQKIATYMANKASVTVRKRDLCAFKVDAIVNAANESLSHMGGLAKALSATGGHTIQAESDLFIAKNGKLKGWTSCSYHSRQTTLHEADSFGRPVSAE